MCKKALFRLLALMILSANSTFALTDTLHYSLQHFTDENGLPQNSVKFIAPDKAGFLWLATENGLVRFEGGDHFRNFNKDELKIVSSRIGDLYLSPTYHELFARTDKQEVIRISNGTASLQEKTAVAADTCAYMVLTGPSDPDPLGRLPNILEKNFDIHPYQLPVKEGACFLIGKDSIGFIRNGRIAYSWPFPRTRHWNFFTLNRQLYYLNEHGQFITFNRDQYTTVELTGDILHDPAYRAGKHRIKLCWNFAASEMFIFLDKSCYWLQQLPDGRLDAALLIRDFNFESNRIMSVYYDVPHRRVFLGSLTRGLFIFTHTQFRTLNKGREHEDEVYYAQARLGDNQVVTPGGVVFNASGLAAILPLIKKVNDKGDRDQHSMATDKWGNIWYKNGQFLYQFNSKGTVLQWTWKCPGEISQLYTGKDDRLWIGTRSGDLYCLSTAMRDVAPVAFIKVVNEITCIQQETADTMWIGSSNGLYRLQLSTRRIESIPGLAHKHIRSLYIPSPGLIWITTYDDGFFLYRDNQLTNFPLDQKKYLSTAHCLVEDDKGYCWIPTNKGLFRVARRDLLAYARKEQSYVYYLYYGKDKGFNTNEFNGGCQPCAVRWADGSISLPSLDGLVFFSPVNIHTELPDKGLYIDQVTLNGKPLAYNDTLLLPHAFQQLKLYVSVPYFGDPYNLQISYALTGDARDTIWLPLNNDHTLSFSTLPSGAYRLHIRQINGFGKNNYTEKILVLTVQQAYYETTWFRLLVVLGLVSAIAAYIRIRTYQIKQQNKVLESRVSARTAELQTTMTSLTFSEKKLRRQTRTQERLIASITHDLKTPMKYLMMLAGNMSWKKQEELEPEMVVKSSKAIYDASYRMYYLIENLIQYIRTHVQNGSAVAEEIDLHELLEEKIDIFSSIAQSRFTSIVNDVPPDLQFYANYQVLGIVIHNLLDNAVKHTRNGVIKLSAVSCVDKVSITIEDTGMGLPPVLLDWINNYHYFNGSGEAASPLHNGMGLIIVLELLELANGKLWAENKPGNGAIVKIELNTF